MAIVSLYSAATGLRALSQQLDVISNNIANSNNNGFKASRANFEDLMYQYQQLPGAKNALGDTIPSGIATGYGTRINSTQLDMKKGSMVVTGNDMDLYIDGDGFFQVTVPADQGSLAYTRTGQFFTNDKGELVLNGTVGYKLNPPVIIPANTTKISIGNDGRVMCTVSGSSTPTEAGQIQLARFPNPQGLIQIGGNMYSRSDASGAPVLANPGSEGVGTLTSGSVEGSNVDPVKELVELIKTQRAFELNSQSIQAADQMLQQISNLRRG
jgi:flagellar basal-body rod protein FlgG